MLPEWKNSGNYSRHLKAMESFRRAHPHFAVGEPEKPAGEIINRQLNRTYTPRDSHNFLTDEDGHTIVRPMWDIEMPGGSQN